MKNKIKRDRIEKIKEALKSFDKNLFRMGLKLERRQVHRQQATMKLKLKRTKKLDV